MPTLYWQRTRDADRVGIAVKNTDNEFVLLNGNQTGSMLINYLLTAWQENGKLTGKEYIVKTIVTTNLIEEIAKAKNVKFYNTLTGFKYIGELMTKFEGKQTFIGRRRGKLWIFDRRVG